MGLLENKVVLITGASRGIGRSIAVECVKQGAKVAFTYLSSAEKAKALEDELTANGGIAKGFKSDASDFDQAQQLVEEVVKEFETVDVLINNAGITRDTLLMRMTEEQWDEVISTNLKSAFNLTKAVIRPMLKARAGSIINMSSVVGVSGNAGQANYAASKAGLIGFTKAIAQENANKGVTANIIAPGYVGTDMVKKIDPNILKTIVAQIPVGRLAEPSEIAALASYLASDQAGFITGATFSINGGQYMQ